MEKRKDGTNWAPRTSKLPPWRGKTSQKEQKNCSRYKLKRLIIGIRLVERGGGGIEGGKKVEKARVVGWPKIVDGEEQRARHHFPQYFGQKRKIGDESVV